MTSGGCLSTVLWARTVKIELVITPGGFDYRRVLNVMTSGGY